MESTKFTFCDEQALQNLMRLAVAGVRTPVREAEPPRAPGVYIQFLAVDEADLSKHPELAAYGLARLRGAQCVYVGAATQLADRNARHITNLGKARNLSPANVWTSHIEFDTWGEALLAEYLLEVEFKPVWGKHHGLVGHGSRPQGRVRTPQGRGGQKASPWDALHRRSWAPTPTIAEATAAQLRLAAFVSDASEEAGLWAPLSDLSVDDLLACGSGTLR